MGRPFLGGWPIKRLAVQVSLLLASGLAFGQALRIGGFDFNGTARVEGTYSSNADRRQANTRPPGVTDADYWLSAGLDLSASKMLSPTTRADIDAGVTLEKHFKRPDLDNTENSLGHLSLRLSQEMGRYTIDGSATYDHSAESQPGKPTMIDPTGNGMARDPQENYGYAGGVGWNMQPFDWQFRYSFDGQKHDMTDFEDRDQEIKSLDFTAGWAMTRRFRPNFAWNKSETTYPNRIGESRIQDGTYFWLPYQLLDRPALTYAFAWQKENRDDGTIVAWGWRHQVSLRDSIDLSDCLTLSGNILYDKKQYPRLNEYPWSWGLSLRHQINRTTEESVQTTRQQMGTFGTTLTSDSTTYGYTFSKRDFFIYGLLFEAGYTYVDTIPPGTSAEQISNNYDFSLGHTARISHKLKRVLTYTYSLQDMNTQPEPLEEHRLTLSYQYDL